MKIEFGISSKDSVDIDLYPYAAELYEELDKLGIIERIKEVPQLGTIKVRKKLAKTRFDYIMLQLYLHQLIKTNLQGELHVSYNNYINAKEFRKDYSYPNKKDKKPTMGDIFQLLTIVYNIGHFYNTFTASRAITMLANENDLFYSAVVNACKDERYQNVAKTILQNKNYQRLHLLNSILVLEQCDKSKQSVSIALEILYSYINEQSLPVDNRLKETFMIFKNVRTLSYMAYDLQIAKVPLTIDLCDKEAMLVLLKELLSEYNNNESLNSLVRSIIKLLDDTVYNENSNAICYYRISKKMVSFLRKGNIMPNTDYYNDLFIDKSSVLNRTYKHNRDYGQSQILKLTFKEEHRNIAEKLLSDLEKINNTRVGYYDRNSGEQTILVSIRKNCDSSKKKYAAYKTLKCTINYLRQIPNITPSDKRFLLATKFFLFYLFDENNVVIKPTISRNICVICTRGKRSRIKEIQSLLNKSIGDDDQNHEVDFLLKQISDDTKNDTAITIPASILVFRKDKVNEKLSEFDGLIIYPMRKENQVIFLEAKNIDGKPSTGKKCLKKALDKFSFEYNSDDIKQVGYDACWKYSIK